MTKCSHNLSRGLSFKTGRYYTFCQSCGQEWHDGGKRWQADPIAQAKVKAWKEGTQYQPAGRR